MAALALAKKYNFKELFEYRYLIKYKFSKLNCIHLKTDLLLVEL